MEPYDASLNQNKFSNSDLVPNDISLLQASKSLCKIYIKDSLSSGFLIKFFKDTENFFCLMTNEHSVTKENVAKKEKMFFYFDNEAETREILLDTEERFIKDFRDIGIDSIIIEILPKDKIPNNYFLLTNIDYILNFNELINKEIAILQYPSGVSSHSYGKIKSIKNYQFKHSASTLPGSSGSPVFLKNSTKIIGIHKGGSQKSNYGDLIAPIFHYFRHYSDNKIL